MLAALLLAACVDRSHASLVPDLTVEPTSLAIVDAIVGDDNRETLHLVNLGTADSVIDLAVDPPFEVALVRMDIAPGAAIPLLVYVDPVDWTPLSGALHLRGAFVDIDVPLSATVDPDGDDDGHDATGAGGDDCDDADPASAPGLPEICDGADNDCDGRVDVDAIDALDWYADLDDDGYGTGAAEPSCAAPGDSWAAAAGDCDDADPTVHPGAVETWYDGVDSDCSGGSDFDRDGDGYDNAGTGGDDCLDSNSAVNPGATEIPGNGIDDDCDLLVDE